MILPGFVKDVVAEIKWARDLLERNSKRGE